MIKNYTCFIHRPGKSVPIFLAVTCVGFDRAMFHAERAASEWTDWETIAVFEADRPVAVRHRAQAA